MKVYNIVQFSLATFQPLKILSEGHDMEQFKTKFYQKLFQLELTFF